MNHLINLALLRHRGWRLLIGRKTYQDLCDKQWTLCAAEKSISPSAIYLEEEIDKVTGVQEETTVTWELQRIRGGVKEHSATTVYQLRDVQINSGYVYKRSMKLPLTTAKEAFFNLDEPEDIPEAALACTYVGNRYFGHWFTDDLTLTLAAQQLTKAVRTAQKLTAHQLEYSDLFNLYSHSVNHAHFRKLHIIQDFGQNNYKRQRYDYLRSQLQHVSSPQPKPGVMLLRGSSGTQRLLVNENDLAEYLRTQGFTVIDPEKTSAREIVLQTLGAKILVGVEGSQLVHGLFTLHKEGVIVTLQSPSRFNNVFKDYTDCLGLKYSFVVGRQVNNGFEISIEDLARTLDKVSSSL